MIDRPRCFERGCVHYEGVLQDSEDGESNERHHCMAFPNGIPDEIAYGDNPHEEVHPDQNGDLTFEKE